MNRRPSPVTVALLVALLLVVGGTSYAAGKSSGNALIKKSSLSGNRLKPDTVAGKQVKESALARVPRAALADKVVPVPRNPIPLDSNWAAGTEQNLPPTYGVDAQGWVHLEGAVKRTGTGTAIGRLPAGARPGAFIYVPVHTLNGEPGTIWIDPEGAIVFVSGTPNFVSLDGVDFRAVS